MAILGNGATLSFAGTPVEELYEFDLSLSRPMVPSTHLSSSGGATFLAGEHVVGEISLRGSWEGDDVPFGTTAVSVSTTSDGSAALWTFDAFVRDARISVPPADEGRREIELTLQITGNSGATT